MPLDVDALVISNTRLSPAYNVLALAAPELARQTQPGQFVMVKVVQGSDPLLRRPFSVFEILRDPAGTVSGLSLLSKRVGPTTHVMFHADPGDHVRCLGPLGRPFVAVDRHTEAWMIAGGVGLAPFATLAEALRSRGTDTTLFYGARHAGELFALDLFERLGCRLVLATEDGSRGVHGRVTLALEQALQGRASTSPLMLYACGPEPMLAAAARVAAAQGRTIQVSVERVMGCGLGGCYSCVVPIRSEGGGSHHVRSCLSGPVFQGDEVVWS